MQKKIVAIRNTLIQIHANLFKHKYNTFTVYYEKNIAYIVIKTWVFSLALKNRFSHFVLNNQF